MAGVVASVVLFGCAANSDRTAAGHIAADEPTEASGTALEPVPSQSPIQVAAPLVTLAFAGDIHFEDDVRARLVDPTTTLAPIADAVAGLSLA